MFEILNHLKLDLNKIIYIYKYHIQNIKNKNLKRL
jgi:hypothetical protein